VNPEPKDLALKQVEPCTDHRKKRWVIAVYDTTRCPEMCDLADQLGVRGCPFLFAQAAAVAETICIYQVSEKDAHKPKAQLEGCVSRLAFVKKGNQVDKVCETIDAVKALAARTFGNMRVVRPVPAMRLAVSGAVSGAASASADDAQGGEEDGLEGPMYDEILATVLNWGVNRFGSHVENCKIRKAERRELSIFDQRVLIVQSSLREAVRLYEDASDMVFRMESEQQKKAAPLPWEVGASDYAKGMMVYNWNN
jgi:hypothetical protein